MFDVFGSITGFLPQLAWWHYPILGVLLFYGVAPLLILTSVKARRDTRVSELDPEMAPDEVQASWREMAASLREHGFGAPFWLRIDGPVGDGWNAVQMQIHPDRAVVASHFCLMRPGGSVQLTYQEFMTSYRPRREVLTNNSGQPTAFASVPEKVMVSLPGLSDTTQIYRAHLANMSLNGRGELDRLTRERMLAELGDEIRRDLERQAKLGYFQLAGNQFRPTIKGAYLMTWRLLFPLKGMRARARAAQARVVLEVAGALPSQGGDRGKYLEDRAVT